MTGQVHIHQAFATAADSGWTLSSCDLSVTYGFDENSGFLLKSFVNGAGSRKVEYIGPPCPLLPFEQRVRNDPGEIHVSARKEDRKWKLTGGKIEKTVFGGKPVIGLTAAVCDGYLQVTLYAVIFPGTSVLRQWFKVLNTDPGSDEVFSVCPFSLDFELDDRRDVYYAATVHGGETSCDLGLLREQMMGTGWSPPEIKIADTGTARYMPVMLFQRDGKPRDGFMVALEYTGPWSMRANRNPLRQNPNGMHFRCETDCGSPLKVSPMETVALPAVTLAVYAEDRDNLMRELYDWQYTYMWDYTNTDYFAKVRSVSRWVFCSRNLHEQFVYRTSGLGMDAILCQRMGIDILWDDAGWSACPEWPENSYGSVFKNNYEGPDFRLNQRFFRKCGIRWLLWFAGKPSNGLLNTKQGAWGVFEWRTDGLGVSDIRQYRDFIGTVQNYLDEDNRRSFHTCSGGSRYSHTFDMQRYANYNYLSDAGGGYCGTYYFSYLEIPDRWGDILNFLGSDYRTYDGSTLIGEGNEAADPSAIRYDIEQARAVLALVPLAGPYNCDEDIERSRIDYEIYHYLLEKGVAGRGSYMYHPEITGDKRAYYMQRVSRDRKRSCMIMRHRPEGKVVIFARGLLSDEMYDVSFQVSAEHFIKSGSELMNDGITTENTAPGEIVYIGMPDHPGAGTRKTPPACPDTVYKCFECNIGHSGTGIYWSGKDPAMRSEVSKNGQVISDISIGQYFFDDSGAPGESADYAVRSVDYDGNRSEWKHASLLRRSEKKVWSALGVFHQNMEESGWTAEYSYDLEIFYRMEFIAPEHTPMADYYGTPNQKGGIEGWWTGGKCAKIGHGWQQASSDVYCARTFLCPENGEVSVTGRAVKEWYHNKSGDDLTVIVYHNREIISGWHKLSKGDLYGAAHMNRLTVQKGDRLRFILGKSSGENEEVLPWETGANIVGWIPVITYENETEDRSERNIIRVSEKNLMCHTDKNIIYHIPVPDDLYAVRFVFEETEYRYTDERVMRIKINHKTVESCFDIMQASRSTGKTEKVYRYIVPSGGEITAEIEALAGKVCLSEIEVIRESTGIIQINCGAGVDFIDWSGSVWGKDALWNGECISAPERAILHASPTEYDRRLYFTAACGKTIGYCVPADSGLHSVQLKFCELWLGKPGLRPMNIYVNDKRIRQNWDPYLSAGLPDMTSDIRTDDVSPLDGKIHIRVEACGDNPAILQAIQID